jgi:hypothetical protein
VLIKSRRRLTKSSGGERGHSDRAIKDEGDTCRDRGGGVANTLLQGVWRFGPQNPVRVRYGLGGGMWCHHEACIEVKQSREELVAVRCINLKLDHFAPWLSSSAKISRGFVGNV